MKGKFKKWRSSIPPISTKRTIIYYSNWTYWTQKRPQDLMFEIQILAWDRHKNVVGLNRLMGSLPSRLGNWISNGNTCLNKRWKHAQIRFHSKGQQTIAKMNDNINMDNTIAGSTTHYFHLYCIPLISNSNTYINKRCFIFKGWFTRPLEKCKCPEASGHATGKGRVWQFIIIIIVFIVVIIIFRGIIVR